MRLLVDTHCWLWYLLAPERINEVAQTALGNPENEIFFSVASTWEIVVKFALGKHRDPFDRILIAQAQTDDLRFMTADKVLTAYDVPILWAGV